MKASNLRVEYLKNPMGIDIQFPRFFWNAEGDCEQSAYQIVCSSEGKELWNSGKVASASMTHIRYQGPQLKSRQIVDWSVTLWNEKDEAGDTVCASFEMGFLDKADWRAKWISGNYKVNKNIKYPADCFRKRFAVTGKVKKARLYISACGLYEARINKNRVGSIAFAPGSTDYNKRIYYQVYDVTELLSTENELTAELGDGWFRGSVAAHGYRNAYGKETKLIFQLEIQYEDGRTDCIISDDSVEWSNDGPIRMNDLKDGETVDLTRKPGYAGKAKYSTEKVKGVLACSNNVMPALREEFKPQIITSPSGKKILDFGQNIAGLIGINCKGKKGRIVLLLGEILKDGEFTQDNFQLRTAAGAVNPGIQEIKCVTGAYDKAKKDFRFTPLQRVEIVFDGEADYLNKFCVSGFRYALIESCNFEIDPADFRAVAVYSDMDSTGSFTCSNEKVNQFYKNTVWSMKGNFLDVPTDCPTRERLGWTGDAQIFFETGSYMMDTASFYRKFIQDIEDSQYKNGLIPAVMPFSRGELMYKNTGGSVGWADAIYLLPYRYYKVYGDIEILSRYYPMMKKYAHYLLKNLGHKDKKAAKADPYNKYVYEKGLHLGEWLEPKEYLEQINSNSINKINRLEEATAYAHLTFMTMEDIAHILEIPEDEKLYHEYALGTKDAYIYNVLKEVPDTDRQAKLVRPLALDCVSDEMRPALAKRLAQSTVNRDYCVGTGFLSTVFLLKVLSDAGYVDEAYRTLENEKAPGWLSEVVAGATTVWESWDGNDSKNHYSPGAVCQWMFDTIAGINIAGERHFVIKPLPGGSFNHAEASYQSVYGKVSSGWCRSADGSCRYEIEIPANTSAEIILADGRRESVGPGKHVF